MLRYETLLLARTEMSDDESSMLERQLDKIVSDVQGKLDSFDKWGKYRLAYPVKKNGHGVYILARYQLPEQHATQALQEFDMFLKLKCNELVLRHANVRLKANAPTSYAKPDPIDMSRGGSLDAFFKENKFENLLSSVDMAHERSLGHNNNDDKNLEDEHE